MEVNGVEPLSMANAMCSPIELHPRNYQLSANEIRTLSKSLWGQLIR
jgi:hypothetical protein